MPSFLPTPLRARATARCAAALAFAAYAVAAPAQTPAPAPEDGQAAARTYRPAAPYPAESIENREQGQVLVRVLTNPAGVPLEARLHQSSGSARLDRSAMETVMRWRFQPTPGPEPVWREVPFTFRITGTPAL